MNAKRLFPELTVDIQWAYRQHVERIAVLGGRDVILRKRGNFGRMPVSTVVEREIPIVCSLYGHCVAYVG